VCTSLLTSKLMGLLYQFFNHIATYEDVDTK
jgi:hypothetical protein